MVALADRDDKISGRVKHFEVRKVLIEAAECFDPLVNEWEKMHGRR